MHAGYNEYFETNLNNYPCVTRACEHSTSELRGREVKQNLLDLDAQPE